MMEVINVMLKDSWLVE